MHSELYELRAMMERRFGISVGRRNGAECCPPLRVVRPLELRLPALGLGGDLGGLRSVRIVELPEETNLRTGGPGK